MEEWKTYKLEDLTVDGKGHYGIGAPAVDYDENKYTYLRITDINDDGSLNYSGLKSVDDPEAGKYLLKEGDIVFARTGNSTGRSYYYEASDGQFVFAGFLIKFSIDPAKVNPRFLKYYTHSKPYFEWVQSFDTGATRGNINAQTFGAMEIKLPPREIQDRLVEVLSSLDEKIKLNNRINHNLEEQAQALYKSWFVDFEPFKDGTFVDSELGMIPEGWTIVRFLDIAKLCSGGTPKTDVDAFWDGSIPFFTPKDVMAFPFCLKTEKYITEDGLKHCNSQLYDVFTTFITARGTVGKLCMAGTPMAMNQTNYAICSKTGISPITLYLMSKQIVAVLKNKANGAVFDAITTRDFEGESIVAAPTFVLDRFAQIVRPIFDQILQNEKQTLTLIEQRDSVLPKLMSGRIDSITC